MKNADLPAMPQSRVWQDDMEAHIVANYGAPPSEVTGLTKREHISAMVFAALISRGYDNTVDVIANESVSAADALLERLEQAE